MLYGEREMGLYHDHVSLPRLIMISRKNNLAVSVYKRDHIFLTC